MAIIRWRQKREWDPLGDILDLKDNINKMINTSLRKGGDLSGSYPTVDIFRKGEDYILKSEIPGLNKDDIDITIQDNVVTLKGTKKEETEIKEEDYYHCERVFGSFQRSFELPSVIDRKNVKATYKDGVLEVTIPLAEEAKPKQIKIDIE